MTVPPLNVRVRCDSVLAPALNTAPAAATVAPVPLMVPPDQVSEPLQVTVSSPVNVPPVCCSGALDGLLMLVRSR